MATPSRVKRARNHVGDTAEFTIRGDKTPVSARIVDAPFDQSAGNRMPYVLVFEERNRKRTRWEVNFTDIVSPIRYGV